MIYMWNIARLGSVALCGLILGVNVVLLGQNSQTSSDREQIMMLMEKLADHSAPAEKLVDPKLGGKERQKTLDYFSDPSYQLTLVPTEAPKIEPDGRAIVPVRLHFKNLTSQVDGDADIRFIQRGGAWYFADFNFLGWTLAEIAIYIVGMGIAIAFATGVLILRRRLRKQNMLNGANLVKIFIPIFWPKLFSNTRIRTI